MAKGVNKVILLGRVGKDPEITYSKGGLAIAKFSLATTDSRKVGDNWEDHTEWHKITLFNKTAEFCGQYVTKGSQVYVEGKVTYGSYEVEGVKRYTTDIIGNQMQLLSAGGGEQQPKQKPSNPPSESAQDLSDLPF